jgi:glyoxylase-like metal-dependent hydrolase (beta-lactamase superfamily II)
MPVVARGIEYVDLQFQQHPRTIATALVMTAEGVALVDPGPATCLPHLRTGLAARGFGFEDVRWILLTHIHLDHAGATGSLVLAAPAARVYVHARGAPHLVDPARLLESARRLYGAELERLWGEVRPVPAAKVHALEGGERIVLGDRTLEVAYTPGHAVHHVSYFDAASRLAFVGDTGGIRLRGDGEGALIVIPPTPPPDIDLEAWAASRARILAWQPETIFVTHFGPYDDVRVHLATLEEQLAEMSRLVRATLAEDGTDDDRMARFAERLHRSLRVRVSEAVAREYERAAPFWLCWLGLARYWRKRAGG